MITTLWAKMVGWLLPRKRFVAILLGLLLVVGAGIWIRRHIWPSRPPERPVEEVIKPAQDKVDREAATRLQKQLLDQKKTEVKLRAELARLQAQIESRYATQVDAAIAGGEDALAKLASSWFRPGELARLRAVAGSGPGSHPN